MHDDFLDNRETYLKLEKFWVKVFEVILLQEGGLLAEWKYPYYKISYVNGERFWDGNPIFSAKSEADGRIIRIVQEQKESEAGNLSHWMDKTMDFNNELVIVCELSSQVLTDIKELIKAFVNA